MCWHGDLNFIHYLFTSLFDLESETNPPRLGMYLFFFVIVIVILCDLFKIFVFSK